LSLRACCRRSRSCWPKPRANDLVLRRAKSEQRHAAGIAASTGHITASGDFKKLILARQTGFILTGVLLFEGRLLETILKTEQRTAAGGDAPAATVRIGSRECGARSMRRPRARLVTLRSGGPGSRSGGMTTALRGASLDWDWHVASSQETRTRGQKSPQVERREAPLRLANGEDTPRKRVGRPRRPLKGFRKPLRYLGAPLPSAGGAKKMQATAYPGPHKEYGR
jgi:hypothetical protein